jgi:hypothetical protein
MTTTMPMNLLRRNTLRGLLVLALTVCLSAAPLFAAPMTVTDREHLLVHFEMTTQMVAELVQGFAGPLEYPGSSVASGGGRT